MHNVMIQRALSASVLAFAASLAGCGGNSAAPEGPTGSGGGATATSSSATSATATSASASSTSSGTGGSPIAALTDCVDDDIKDGFSGPGWDAMNGTLVPPAQATYVAATTVLLQSSDPAKQQLFGQLVGPIVGELPTRPGFIGFQLAISSKCHYARTITVWKDMESLMSFVASPNHAHAMANAAKASDEGATTHWDIAATDMPPTWAVARMQIEAMGHLAY